MRRCATRPRSSKDAHEDGREHPRDGDLGEGLVGPLGERRGGALLGALVGPPLGEHRGHGGFGGAEAEVREEGLLEVAREGLGAREGRLAAGSGHDGADGTRRARRVYRGRSARQGVVQQDRVGTVGRACQRA